MNASDTLLLLLLPVLLIASAFFSGTETALFGLTQRERAAINRRGGIASGAVEALLRNPRQLLVTVLLGNMVVNVLYFVVSSVLVLRAPSAAWQVVFGVVPLMGIILLGEVLPKITATGRRDVWCRLSASPMLAMHRVLAVLARPLERFVLEPAIRVVSPAGARGSSISVEELGELLELSQRGGEIDSEEASLLDAVADLGVLRVRDVMTPRVRMQWVDEKSTREEVLRSFDDALPRIVHVCEGSLDSGVTGVLAMKRLLAAPAGSRVGAMRVEPIFVPETAKLDTLLELLRNAHRRVAVVVDEYGAVAGQVSMTDVVGRLVQSLERARHTQPEDAPGVEMIDSSHWRVSGSLSVHDWMAAFGVEERVRASTVSGLLASLLGQLPAVGDTVVFGLIDLTVESMDGATVQSAVVRVHRERAS